MPLYLNNEDSVSLALRGGSSLMARLANVCTYELDHPHESVPLLLGTLGRRLDPRGAVVAILEVPHRVHDADCRDIFVNRSMSTPPTSANSTRLLQHQHQQVDERGRYRRQDHSQEDTVVQGHDRQGDVEPGSGYVDGGDKQVVRLRVQEEQEPLWVRKGARELVGHTDDDGADAMQLRRVDERRHTHEDEQDHIDDYVRHHVSDRHRDHVRQRVQRPDEHHLRRHHLGEAGRHDQTGVRYILQKSVFRDRKVYIYMFMQNDVYIVMTRLLKVNSDVTVHVSTGWDSDINMIKPMNSNVKTVVMMNDCGTSEETVQIDGDVEHDDLDGLPSAYPS
ncbi:hypothetical protein QQS21_011018 [Conoideocrella luteorostrata]|uniref:Uncharacterized protein n=1 Tax=Conoideocrella luteorostrata TaxID=1105319 RepID=A0AAJ0FWA4_9HYPO|nr:hypothetical protein QQS21_011018 [Conoideocrella luteorostrata]